MRCKVIKAYRSAYSDPIRLRAGAIVTWTDKGSEWKGWVWCRDGEGKEGWVPESYLVKNGAEASVTRDYVATELTVSIGETLEILSEEAGWLWCKNNRGESGWVPRENVEEKSRFSPLLRVGNRIILLADGIKVPKSGRKMPAVKLLHQESDSNTKPGLRRKRRRHLPLLP